MLRNSDVRITTKDTSELKESVRKVHLLQLQSQYKYKYTSVQYKQAVRGLLTRAARLSLDTS